jgi:hypothetical protein
VRRSIKRLTILFLSIAIIVLLGFNALLIWVATGPRSLNDISPYIETALSRKGQFQVNIDETWLVWDGWKHPIDIRLRNVSVAANGQEFSAFPEVSLGLHIFSLLQGRILPTSLAIKQPVISLLQNPDHSISFGIKTGAVETSAKATQNGDTPANHIQKPNQAVPFAAVLMPLLMPDEKSNFRKLRYISIQQADLTVGSVDKGVFFNASDANMVFRRNRSGQIRSEMQATIAYDKFLTPVTADLELNQTGIEGNLSFTQLMPGILSNLFSDNPHLKLINVPFDGKAQLAMDLEGHLQHIHFDINGGKGTINSVYMDSVLDVASLHAQGQVHNDFQDIQLDTLTTHISGADITASGTVSLRQDDIAIRAEAGIKNVAAANVHTFWPPSLAPLTREWVTSNITDGTIPEAAAKVQIAFGDLGKPVLPKESIDATIQLKDAVITYLPEHPQVSKVNGRVHVDGMALDATIDAASYMDNTAISKGRVYIADLNPDNPYIEVSFTAQSTAKDMVRFLSLPRLEKARQLNLIEQAASGTVSGEAMVGFYFYAPVDENGNPGEPDITYDAKASLNDVAHNAFMNKFDLKGIKGNLQVNNTYLEFKGGGDVNGANVSESTVKYLFHPENDPENAGFDTFIDAKATAPVSVLPRFDYPAFEFLSGTLGVSANVKQGPEKEASNATLDLTQAAIHTDIIPWKKVVGEPATFEIMADKTNNILTIPSFHLKGYTVDARGSMTLTNDMSAIETLKLSRLRMGETNLDSMQYSAIKGGYTIVAKGLVADVSSWVDDTTKEENETPVSSTFSFEHFPALTLNADIKRVITRKGHYLNDVKAELECNTTRCKFADIDGTTMDGKPFSFRILRNPKGVRQLSINSDNAGTFLGALNIMDGMEDGELTISGEYDDSKENGLLTGRVKIGKHTVRDVPILAKLLTLASFTGIIDTLGGKGIQFDRMRAPFTLSKDVITLKDAKSYGSAMGLTANGTITFPERTMDINGTVVPSYTLNNVLGKVPLVGGILTGNDGGGVFAARYSISGNSNKPSVTVKPFIVPDARLPAWVI